MPPKKSRKTTSKTSAATTTTTTTSAISQSYAHALPLPPPPPLFPNLPSNPLNPPKTSTSIHSQMLHGLTLFARHDALLHRSLTLNSTQKSQFLLSLQTTNVSFDLKKYEKDLKKLEKSSLLKHNLTTPPSAPTQKYTRKIPKIKRPPNAFMLFKSSRLKTLNNVAYGKGDKRNTVQWKTSVIGEEWRGLGGGEREEWVKKAKELGEEVRCGMGDDVVFGDLDSYLILTRS